MGMVFPIKWELDPSWVAQLQDDDDGHVSTAKAHGCGQTLQIHICMHKYIVTV